MYSIFTGFNRWKNAKMQAESGRQDYNLQRSHSALNYLAPYEFMMKFDHYNT